MTRLNLPSCLLLLLAAGCAVGPDYARPETPLPAAYKELKDWKPAEPADEADRGAWWDIYRDPILSAYIKQVDVNNQTVKQYEAAWREARATVAETRSSLFPALSLDKSVTRSGTGKYNAATSYGLSATASWTLDVWGKLRRAAESDEAAAEASAADLAAARLSAQTAVATAYFVLRAADEKQRILDKIVAADEITLGLVTRNYQAGVASQSERLSSQSALETARAAAIANRLSRAKYEHALAVLLGKAPADFELPPADGLGRVPVIPASLPSALLERRPDIAAAERQMAAANARIGVAVAGYFPSFALSASYGFAGSALDNLLKAASSVWSMGLENDGTLLDFGARGGAVDAARAAYDGTVAAYRQTVLDALKEVEDQLAAQRLLADQEAAQQTATDAARRAEQIALNQYRQGIIAYSDVLAAQNSRLSAEQSLLAVKGDRLTASANLIEALGGGWQVPTP